MSFNSHCYNNSNLFLLGAAGHLSASVSNGLSSTLAKGATRVVVSGTTAGASDAICQGVNLASGNQEHYDFERTLISAAASATTTAAFEGAASGIYAINGGKANVLAEKANKQTVQETVPKEHQEAVMKGIKELNALDKTFKDAEFAKAKALTESRNRGDVKIPAVKKNDIQKIGKSNAHFLIKDKLGQVAMDIHNADVSQRGQMRAIYDFDQNSGQCSVSDFTSNHDYKNTKTFNESSYGKNYQQCENISSNVPYQVQSQMSAFKSDDSNDNENDTDCI